MKARGLFLEALASLESGRSLTHSVSQSFLVSHLWSESIKCLGKLHILETLGFLKPAVFLLASQNLQFYYWLNKTCRFLIDPSKTCCFFIGRTYHAVSQLAHKNLLFSHWPIKNLLFFYWSNKTCGVLIDLDIYILDCQF